MIVWNLATTQNNCARLSRDSKSSGSCKSGVNCMTPWDRKMMNGFVTDSICKATMNNGKIRGNVERSGDSVVRKWSKSWGRTFLCIPSSRMFMQSRYVNNTRTDILKLCDGRRIVSLFSKCLMVGFAVWCRSRNTNNENKVNCERMISRAEPFRKLGNSLWNTF